MAYTTINKPSDYFNTKLYTGTGSGNQSVTGVGFQPDWVWTKNRASAYGHNIYDAVRGTGKYLASNSDAVEQTSATSIISYDSDGFTVGTGDNVQYESANGVSWNWLGANGTASNTDGSITSTVSANTTSGFSIVSYTGTGSAATIGHGLSATPKVVIVKRRTGGTNNWRVQHESLGATKALDLDGTAAANTATGNWNDTAPTSSVFSVGTFSATNNNTDTYIAYCFAEKKGYSKFGSYTGNGSTDGTFVYTGFKPAMVILKNASSVNDWHIYDNKRNTFNPKSKYLRPNGNIAEVTDTTKITDFLSNGFKIRTTDGSHNTSGNTYIYMAFAEAPIVGTNNVPANAR